MIRNIKISNFALIDNLKINLEPKLKKLLGRHLLHASSIEFNHPKTSKRIKFSIDIPKDFDTVIKYLS